MERNITFYRIILYVDDGTNVDYIKPQDLNDTDVFSNSDSAWEWCQGKGYEDNCVIKDENDDILNIGDYHFIDFPDDFSETIYKLQTIGQILCNIDFCIVENKRKYGLIDKHGYDVLRKNRTLKRMIRIFALCHIRFRASAKLSLRRIPEYSEPASAMKRWEKRTSIMISLYAPS